MADQETLAGKVLRDLHSGMSDSMLMEKHKLSCEELRNLYRDLFDNGLLLHPQMPGEPFGNQGLATGHEHGAASTEFRKELRRFPRRTVKFPTIIYEQDRAEIHGRVRDVSEQGDAAPAVGTHLSSVPGFGGYGARADT